MQITVVPEYTSQHNLFVYCGNRLINELDFFGFASYKVGLAIQSPNNLNSTVAFNFKTKSAGHAFLELFINNKRTVARGFLSSTTRTALVALTRMTFKGKIRNESNLNRSVTAYYNINKKQYNTIYNLLYTKSIPKYNVVSYNCTTFALEVLKKAGINHKFKKHFWNMGIGFYLATGAGLVFGGLTMLSGHVVKGGIAMALSSIILSFSLSYGYYPARVAYDINRGVK